ncbi:helix-turn-helix domain-containing protein [bacterium]|nr:helix-turn-helix domain-containing protein [bacterium]
MLYKEYQPIGELKNYIKCFWCLEHDYSQEPFKEGERIWPDGHFELIFSHGERYRQKTETALARLTRSFLIGQFSRELLLQSKGRTGLYGVRFFAWGLYPFLQTPMHVFTNRVTDASTICDGMFGAVHESLDPENSVDSLNLLQGFFHDSLAEADTQSCCEPIAREIREKNGLVQIGQLAEVHRVNPRKLQRLFEHEIGISAKLFAKIVRFNRAKNIIQRDPNTNLAEVTFTCGYADQSHFIRNFKALYGITPTQFKRQILRFRAHCQNKNKPVVFVQDTARKK